MNNKKRSLASGITQMLDSATASLNEDASYIKRYEKAEKEVEVTINFKLPKSLHTSLKMYVAKESTTIKELAIMLFRSKLEEENNK